MIKEDNITNFNRSQEELELFFVFCWFSKAAKASDVARKVNALHDHLMEVNEDMELGYSFFEMIKYVIDSDSLETLREFKLGKYNSFAEASSFFPKLDLFHDGLEELTRVPGIGPKIARMFLLHSRPNQKFICLDTHLLKEAVKLGIDIKRNYEEIESLMMKKLENIKCFADYDINKWKSYAM